MAIKTRQVKGKVYYYLEKNIRIGTNFWKTFSIYIGSKKPSIKGLKAYETRLRKQIREYVRNVLVKQKTEFIDEKTALILERIKTSYKAKLFTLGPVSREGYLKRKRETFITNTNAIEGSRLTIDQTKKILELQNRYETGDMEELEVINMRECLELYDRFLISKTELDEALILRLHLLLLKGIKDYESYAGIWRPVNVFIRTSKYKFPEWNKVPKLMRELILWYKNNKNQVHPVELAAKFHSKFVTIHPFADGNGRMARLLLNYILQSNGFPFTDIPYSKRDAYFETQERGHFGNHQPFVLFLVNEIKEQFAELKRKIKKQ